MQNIQHLYSGDVKATAHASWLWVWAFILISISTGCATNPQEQERNVQQRLTVQQILTEPTDAAENEAPRRCINNYRNIEILNDQILLFKSSGHKLWMNQLPVRCPGLRHNSTLALTTDSTFGRLCKLDSVSVVDWFDYPWYRRWPWHWNAGPRCTLGEFQPVTAGQVMAIKQVLSTK